MEIETWKIVVPVLIALFAWLGNEWRKRKWEEYARREKRYSELITALRGFQSGVDSKNAAEMKVTFLDQLNLCWLYCSDDVIHKAYAFLDTVSRGASTTEDEKATAVGDLMLAIRKDLYCHRLIAWRSTKLRPQDFKVLSATQSEWGSFTFGDVTKDAKDAISTSGVASEVEEAQASEICVAEVEIIAAFREVEKACQDLLRAHGHQVPQTFRALESRLKQHNLIDDVHGRVLDKLRQLRNIAVHRGADGISKEDAAGYVNLAETMIAYLESISDSEG